MGKTYSSYATNNGKRAIIQFLLNRDGAVCQLCGESLDEELRRYERWARGEGLKRTSINMNIDHIVPRSVYKHLELGEKPYENLANLQLTHYSCNIKKGNSYDEKDLMKLRNPFPREVRLLYLYNYKCFNCGSNEMLELHHIMGRISDSAFNACPLCHKCHDKVTHSREEHTHFFRTNFEYLLREGYSPTPNDYAFLEKNPEILGEDFASWVKTTGRVEDKPFAKIP